MGIKLNSGRSSAECTLILNMLIPHPSAMLCRSPCMFFAALNWSSVESIHFSPVTTLFKLQCQYRRPAARSSKRRKKSRFFALSKIFAVRLPPIRHWRQSARYFWVLSDSLFVFRPLSPAKNIQSLHNIPCRVAPFSPRFDSAQAHHLARRIQVKPSRRRRRPPAGRWRRRSLPLCIKEMSTSPLFCSPHLFSFSSRPSRTRS